MKSCLYRFEQTVLATLWSRVCRIWLFAVLSLLPSFAFSSPLASFVISPDSFDLKLESILNKDQIKSGFRVKSSFLHVYRTKYSEDLKGLNFDAQGDFIMAKIESDVKALKSHFFKLAETHQAQILKDGAKSIYFFKDGISFYRDFLMKVPNMEMHGLAMQFLFNTGQRWPKSMALFLFLEPSQHMLDFKPEHSTLLLDGKDLSAKDRTALYDIAKMKGLQIYEINGDIAIGGGFSLLMLTKVLEAGTQIKDPVLKARYERAKRHLKAEGVVSTSIFFPFAAGAYLPDLNLMTITRPDYANLNTFTHEATHARFDKFTRRLQAWMKARDFVLPYEMEGPKGGVRFGNFEPTAEFGGFFNLLNEVNSFRVGNSFDGQNSDAEILKTLRESYGRQAGEEAAQMFSEFWSTEKLNDKAVAYLIFQGIRKFNSLSDADVQAIGRLAVENKDLAQQDNFLRLLRTKRHSHLLNQSSVKKLLQEVMNHSTEPHLQMEAGKLIGEQPRKYNAPESVGYPDDFAKLMAILENKADYALENFMGTREMLNQMKPEHVEMIARKTVEKALSTGGDLKHYLAILEFILYHHDIKPVGTADQGTSVRTTAKSHWVLQALDKAWSEKISDSSPTTAKASILPIILRFTFPQEMPLVFQKVVSILSDSKIPETQRRIAEEFLYFLDSSFKIHPVWGEQILAKVLQPGVTLHPQTTIAIVRYLDRVLIPSLKTGTWGHDLNQGLDKRARSKALFELTKLSNEQKSRLAFTEYLLFKYLRDANREVRITALHALLTTPLLLVHIEKKLVASLHRQDSAILDVINHLKKVIEPGFLPVLDTTLVQNQKLIPKAQKPRVRCEKVRF